MTEPSSPSGGIRIDPPRLELRPGYRRPEVRPVPGEHAVRIEDLFFSTTNLKGIIQSGNSVFVRISGFTAADLLGAPHNMVRHPEMPRTVFKLLWDTIQARRPLSAYVKNISRDGKAYWVLANVFPVVVGGELLKYISVRTKPLAGVFAEVPALYEAVRAAELAAPAGDKGGMQAGAAAMQAGLARLGFPDYAAFMTHLLMEESRALMAEEEEAFPVRVFRSTSAGNGVEAAYPVCHRASSRLSLVLRNLDVVRGAMGRIERLRAFTGDFAYRVRLLSLNTVLTASAAGREGATIGIIAQNILECSREAEEQASVLDELASSSRTPLEGSIDGVVLVKIQLLMVFKFLEETLAAGAGLDAAALAENDANQRDLLYVLLQRIEEVRSQAGRVQEIFQRVLRTLEAQSAVVRKLMSSQNFGRLQTVHATTKRAALETLFREIRACGEEARATVDDLVVDFHYMDSCFEEILDVIQRVRADAISLPRLIAR